MFSFVGQVFHNAVLEYAILKNNFYKFPNKGEQMASLF